MNLRAVTAAIGALMAAAFAVVRIKRIAAGSGTVQQKVESITEQVNAVLTKMDKWAEATDATWDDSLVDLLSDVVNNVAVELLEQLGAA
ncbi:MAG: hypothetical protein LLG08_04095 [Actinomycetia bacterium]|nr:hypothetical protein [Actinomycetes bacterium]